MSDPPIVLASASPRRRQILETLGIEVDVRPTNAEEHALDIEDHDVFVEHAASLKLRHGLDATFAPGQYVLAADTIVCLPRERFGKPSDDDEALSTLMKLAGRDHLVWTSVALGRVGEGELGHRTVATRVWFRMASRDQLRRYVALGEGRDKAGAYGIQGAASAFVHRIDGSYSNVVGLPAAEVVDLLLEHGALGAWP